MEWREKQLRNLEDQWSDKPQEIQSEDDLQPMWRDMEKRVKNRKPRTKSQTGGLSGRRNIKKTDEEMWLREGLYGAHDDPAAEK